MAIEEKFGRLKQLMDTGKEKGYVLYDEVNELLTEDYPGGRELDDLLTELDSAGVEILEEPKIEFDKKLEEGEELGDLELAQDFSERPTIRCACICARWARFRCSRAKAKSSWPSASSAGKRRCARRCPVRRW